MAILKNGHFEKSDFLLQIFFFLIPMKISHKLCGRMDGSQFWCFPWFPANSLLCVTVQCRYYVVDAVGSSQIFFPTQNLERAYQVDKESKAVLSYFQYDQCAGPQKQEDINGHSSTIVGQKIKVRDVFQSGNQGNFLVLSKKIWKKKFTFFFSTLIDLRRPKIKFSKFLNQHCAYFLL